MTRNLCRFVSAFVTVVVVVACSGGSSDVRETAFAADPTPVTFDQSVAWSCGDADLQATFAPTFTGDALVAAVKNAIADPAKTDATFSFIKPIDSFETNFDSRSLCMHLTGATSSPSAEALVRRLLASGNVVSVRTHD